MVTHSLLLDHLKGHQQHAWDTLLFFLPLMLYVEVFWQVSFPRDVLALLETCPEILAFHPSYISYSVFNERFGCIPVKREHKPLEGWCLGCKFCF